MALACPKRIAEFHATSLLESSISTVEVILRPHLGVTAKNHSHCFAPEEIVIKPLEINYSVQSKLSWTISKTVRKHVKV